MTKSIFKVIAYSLKQIQDFNDWGAFDELV